MPTNFEFHGYRASGGEGSGGTRIHQSGRNVTINGKPVFGLRKWMVFGAAALVWLGVLALVPWLGIVWFLLALVAGAVYLLTRD